MLVSYWFSPLFFTGNLALSVSRRWCSTIVKKTETFLLFRAPLLDWKINQDEILIVFGKNYILYSTTTVVGYDPVLSGTQTFAFQNVVSFHVCFVSLFALKPSWKLIFLNKIYIYIFCKSKSYCWHCFLPFFDWLCH